MMHPAKGGAILLLEKIFSKMIIGIAIRRSSRQSEQPGYLIDYEVQLNHYSVVFYFLMGDSVKRNLSLTTILKAFLNGKSNAGGNISSK